MKRLSGPQDSNVEVHDFVQGIIGIAMHCMAWDWDGTRRHFCNNTLSPGRSTAPHSAEADKKQRQQWGDHPSIEKNHVSFAARIVGI
jgi:hypothetical protein